MSGIFDQIVTYSPRTVDGSGGTVLLAANNLGDVSSAENARLNIGAASEAQATGRASIVQPPSGLPGLPGKILKRYGKYELLVDWSSYDRPRAISYYVDSVAGSDSNSGLTAALPKQTLSATIAAAQTGGVSARIVLQPGSYLGGWGASNNPTISLSVVCPAGRAILMTGRSGTDFSLYSGVVYTRSGHSVPLVVDLSRTEGAYNLPLRYTQVADVAAVTATPGSFAIVGGAAYIRCIDDRAPDAQIVTSGDGALCRWQGSGSLYLKNLTLIGGASNIRVAPVSPYDPLVVLDGVRGYWTNPGGAGAVAEGFDYDGAGVVLLRDTEFSGAKKDGFSYHQGSASIGPIAIEQDCRSFACGGEDTSCNATTMHDGGSVVRLNGIYAAAQDRVVHDIGAGKSWNLGCVAASPTGAGADNNVAWASGTPSGSDATLMYLEECNAQDALTSLAAWGGSSARIYVRRTEYDQAAVIGSSKIEVY